MTQAQERTQQISPTIMDLPDHYWWSEFLNLLSLNGDKLLTSPYSITTLSNMQVIRIKKMINNDQISWFLIKFSLLVT